MPTYTHNCGSGWAERAQAVMAIGSALHANVLTNWFSGFLRRRRAMRHFARHPLLATLAGRGPSPPIPITSLRT